MNLYKSLREIDDDLPNGFHDAHLEAVTVSFASNSAKMDLQLFVGDPGAAVRGGRASASKTPLRLVLMNHRALGRTFSFLTLVLGRNVEEDKRTDPLGGRHAVIPRYNSG